MTCDRCSDIHLAQRNGTNCDPCRCDCHYNTTGTAQTTICIPYDNSAAAKTNMQFWSFDNSGDVQR